MAESDVVIPWTALASSQSKMNKISLHCHWLYFSLIILSFGQGEMDKKFTFHALDWWIGDAHELNIVFLHRNFHLITDKDVKQNVTQICFGSYHHLSLGVISFNFFQMKHTKALFNKRLIFHVIQFTPNCMEGIFFNNLSNFHFWRFIFGISSRSLFLFLQTGSRSKPCKTCRWR